MVAGRILGFAIDRFVIYDCIVREADVATPPSASHTVRHGIVPILPATAGAHPCSHRYAARYRSGDMSPLHAVQHKGEAVS